MSIDRLSGGLTPKDGADPRTFPTIWNETADEIERIDGDVTALEGRVGTAEGDISALDGRVTTTEGDVTALDGRVTSAEGRITTNEEDIEDLDERVTDVEVGFRFVGTRYFFSDGNFEKDDPFDDGNPDGLVLRAIRVRVVGGGGGGGGAATTGSTQTSSGQGGAGGAYGESFITDIAGLDASISVTRGAGGVGVSDANGTSGSPSSFGSLVTAGGGAGGFRRVATAPPHLSDGSEPGAVGVGDVVVAGGSGTGQVSVSTTFSAGGNGGSSVFGGGGRGRVFNNNGSAAVGIGAGGGGGANAANQGTARLGGDGANGIVIVDCFV